ncbi:MAG: phospholipase D family protein [Crocinitomicaceae bacterium]|nr:phospholipase D family protein [Crocinitomicaceae bacterium]
MGWFLNKDELISELYNILRKAKRELVIVSPYFKLSTDLKHELDNLKSIEKLKIKILFGKNSEEKTKSMSKEDFQYLKDHNSIEIRYDERLHAKYYANEKKGIVTSLNFHEFSIQNNVEVGALYEYSRYKDFLDKIFGDTVFTYNSYADNRGKHFFNDQFDRSRRVFKKENGKVEFDYSEEFFNPKTDKKNIDQKVIKEHIQNNSTDETNTKKNLNNSGLINNKKRFNNAGAPWTEELDQQLEMLFCEGKSIKEMMEHFERSNGAIRSRIEKLELEEKYPK